MHFLKSFNYSLDKNKFLYLNFFLPIIIIFSSLKIYGYVCFFIIYLPYVLSIRKKIFHTISKSDPIQKYVLCFFIFLILSTIQGFFYLNDIRILLYWIPFFTVLSTCYFKNIYDINNNIFYQRNYIKIINKSSIIYFIFYLVMNLLGYGFTRFFYSIQDKWWMGSSGAFCISSLLFYSLIQLWEKEKFNIFSRFTFIFIGYILIVYINESRLGILYILLFSLFLLLKNLKLKNLLNAFLLFIIVFTTYTTSSYIIGLIQNQSVDVRGILVEKNRNIIKDAKILMLSNNNDRKAEIIKGLNKFNDYPTLNKIIGTGWYSSRITINLTKAEIRNQDFNYVERKPFYLQGIVSILLDTGIVGIFFLLSLFGINIVSIYDSKNNIINKTFYTLLLAINFLSLFLGFPLVNLAYILFILPDGIIFLKNKKISLRKIED